MLRHCSGSQEFAPDRGWPALQQPTTSSCLCKIEYIILFKVCSFVRIYKRTWFSYKKIKYLRELFKWTFSTIEPLNVFFFTSSLREAAKKYFLVDSPLKKLYLTPPLSGLSTKKELFAASLTWMIRIALSLLACSSLSSFSSSTRIFFLHHLCNKCRVPQKVLTKIHIYSFNVIPKYLLWNSTKLDCHFRFKTYLLYNPTCIQVQL